MLAANIVKEIMRLVNEQKEAIIGFLQDLLRIPSMPGEEKDCALFCANKLKEMRFQTDIWEPQPEELKNHPAYNTDSPETSYKNRPNVVAVLKGTGGGRSILLNGHTDAVPTGALDSWTHHPWSGAIEDDKIFGRGAIDMKGGISAMIKAVEVLQLAGIRLKGDVIIECVVDEEKGGSGTLASIIRGYKAEAGIVVEPFGVTNLVVGHRGSLGFRIVVEGRTAPLDSKAGGVNAIEKMQIIIKALEEFKAVRQKTITHPAYAQYDNPVPILVGTIQGGCWLTSVPLRCIIEGFLGWLPNESLEDVKRFLREQIRRASVEDLWLKKNPPKVEFPSLYIRPCRLDSHHPLIKTLEDSATVVCKKDIRRICVNVGADQWLLNLYGKTPTVQFGPGGGNAHGPNEFIYISELINCTKILALTIMEWCGTE